LEVREGLARLHCSATERAIRAERGILQAWGGGCHQRFGATQETIEGLGDLLWIRGQRSSGEPVDELRWQRDSSSLSAFVTKEGSARRASWDGQALAPWDGMSERGKNRGATALPQVQPAHLKNRCVFVAHWRAVDAAAEPELWTAALRSPQTRVWVSGTSSWEKLAARGVWVEGSGEGLGFDQLRQSTLSQPVLGLAQNPSEWTVLTHADAEVTWTESQVLATYRSEPEAALSEDSKRRLQAATHVYWGSASQWEALKHWVLETAIHSCGPGKTADRLRRAGVPVWVFPNVEEWRRTVGLPVSAAELKSERKS
jgi:hydroxymethylbilane synthase